ncbi:translocating chain-associated membrane protein 2 isoform X2 [Salmo trutta]|uniref:translocating chain-associated membrane protein 2 isoform X2 n=1 Tax=Salmo trutta TaxID=8032 RepID=UPI001131E8A2|nr:translocating chain-associated membrane protein 2-like isoform X2 [Salmo trutta]
MTSVPCHSLCIAVLHCPVCPPVSLSFLLSVLPSLCPSSCLSSRLSVCLPVFPLRPLACPSFPSVLLPARLSPPSSCLPVFPLRPLACPSFPSVLLPARLSPPSSCLPVFPLRPLACPSFPPVLLPARLSPPSSCLPVFPPRPLACPSFPPVLLPARLSPPSSCLPVFPLRPLACLFVLRSVCPEGEVTLYQYGWQDCTTILFYFFITIILHAVVQEYVLDKVNRRLHLSKSKNTKFSESGQLCVFHLVSSVWSFYILLTEGYVFHPSSLWENYPHVHLRFQVKFFYLTQLAYWLHALPEIYFQKVRKEEIPRQLQYICLYLLHISAAYLLNLSPVGLVLLCLQYLSELGFHIARIFYFTDESHQKMFDLWAVNFVFTRMVTLTLVFLAVGFGLARAENQGLDWDMGNFNTVLIRMPVLLLVSLTQSWLLWKFIRFQLKRWREFRHEQVARKRAAAKQTPRPLKRDSIGHHENGAIKAENGASPRPKKIKAP